MADLAADYLRGVPEAQAFFGSKPDALFDLHRIQYANAPGRRLEFYRALGMDTKLLGSIEKWQEIRPEENLVESSHPVMPPKLAAELQQYQRMLGLDRSFTGREHVIITGQQPGLLTGPLYTIYKAISALKLAEEFRVCTGRDCLPVFWIAADDHDFEEVRAANILSRKHDLLSLRYEPESDAEGLPMFRVPLEEQLHRVVDEAADAAPGSEFAKEVRDFLHDSLNQSTSFSGWFARLMARLFRDTPLVFFTTEQRAARDAAKLLMRREIQDPLRTTRLVNEAAERLRDSGYEVQLEKRADECSFFIFEQGRRRKVTHDGTRFVLPEIAASFTTEELLQRLNQHPEDFSANAALRTLVQQALFHPEAYVAGPGEIAYWAQFAELFQSYALPMPVVYPRSSALLSTVKLNKLRAKLRLDPEQLLRGPESALDHAMLDGDSPALQAARTGKVRILGEAEKLLKALEDCKATAALRGMGGNFLDQTRQNLERLELAAARDDERQLQAVRQQVERLCVSLAPARKPQERVYSIFSFLFEHGWDLIPKLIQELDPQRFDLQEIEL